MKEFKFKGVDYFLHYDADEYGVYGICRANEEMITFVNELSKRYNKEYRQAYNFAIKVLKLTELK